MHNKKENNTAILVFALSSQEEQKHKKIDKGSELFKALSEHTLKTVQKTGLPYFHLTENEQKGNSFGERFTNAIQTIYNKGFEQIITIGNDSPQLTSSHLLEACFHLENGKTVIGPSSDGGFYLMGLHKAQFKASDFERLSWKTSKLFLETAKLLKEHGGELIRLQTFMDLDNKADLQLFINRFKSVSTQLSSLIISLIFFKKSKIFYFKFIFISNYLSENYYNKGSPFVLHS